MKKVPGKERPGKRRAQLRQDEQHLSCGAREVLDALSDLQDALSQLRDPTFPHNEVNSLLGMIGGAVRHGDRKLYRVLSRVGRAIPNSHTYPDGTTTSFDRRRWGDLGVELVDAVAKYKRCALPEWPRWQVDLDDGGFPVGPAPQSVLLEQFFDVFFFFAEVDVGRGWPGMCSRFAKADWDRSARAIVSDVLEGAGLSAEMRRQVLHTYDQREHEAKKGG